MGLKSSPSNFQRLVEMTMRGLNNVIVYIDDLILHSKTHEEHREDLQRLFDRLRTAGLKANLRKCNFGSDNVSYLGFRLTPRGILPGIDKLQAVRDSVPPTTVHQVRQFLGLCNFFRAHIRNFSLVSCPLNQLTRKDTPWRGGELPLEALKAFNELKSALCSEPVVAYPRKDRPYALIVDAATGRGTLEGGVGAILTQLDPQGNFNVIAYASRALVKHEKNYTPFLLEMMAGVWAMNHFDNYLRGRKFTLFTDHRPLEKLATVHKKTLNRLQEAMLEYDFVIKYKAGADMPADFLSRNVLAAIDVFTPDLPVLQIQDKFVGAVRRYMLTQQLPRDGARAAHVKRVAPECFIENDVIWRRLTRYDAQPRTVLLVPAVLAPALVSEAHGQILTGHDGISKTKERLLQSYYWPNMDADISNHIEGCQRCQARRKDDRPQPCLITPLPQCSEGNQRVHVDLFGPLKTSESGKKYVLVMTDAFNKYVEIVATPNKEAPTVSLAIFNRWICRFGCPLEIVSDGGKEFVNNMSKELYQLLDIKHSKTTSYHPACNAQVERFNQTVAKYLASFTDTDTLDWEYYLPPLAFSYNTSLHRTTKATPYFLTYGAEARLPSFPSPDLQRLYGESEPAQWFQRLCQARHLAVHHSLQASARMEQDFNKKARPHNYQIGQMVWLQVMNFLGKNRKLAPTWDGPFQILKIFDFGVVDLACTNRIQRVNMDRIKPYVPPVGLQRRETETDTHQPTVQTKPRSTFYTTPSQPKEQFSQNERSDVSQRKLLPNKNSFAQNEREKLSENNFSQNTKNYLLQKYMEKEKTFLEEKSRRHEDKEKVLDTDAPTVPQEPSPLLKRGRGRPRKAIALPGRGGAGERALPGRGDAGEGEKEQVLQAKPRIFMPQFQRPPGRSVGLGTDNDERRITRSMSQAVAPHSEAPVPGDGNADLLAVDLLSAQDITLLRSFLSSEAGGAHEAG
jgi:hypothetical protein